MHVAIKNVYVVVTAAHVHVGSGELLERFSMTFTANGKNETFAVCLQLSVQ